MCTSSPVDKIEFRTSSYPSSVRSQMFAGGTREDIPTRPTSTQTTALNPTTTQIGKTYPRFIPRPTYCRDRFISGRGECNVEAAHYLLNKKTINIVQENEIDIFTQVDSLPVAWRKKFMHQLMVHENAIRGVRQKQVLRSSQSTTKNKIPGNLAGLPKDFWDEEYLEDGMWKSTPRKKPLIGIMDSILDVPGFQSLPRDRFRLVDWSSTNIIAAAIQDTVTFFDCEMIQPKQLSPVENINTCALKWSNAGDKLVITTTQSNIHMYDLAAQKIVWTCTCSCNTKYHLQCFIRCIGWSYDDQHIVTGCRGILSIYLAQTGRLVRTVIAHKAMVLTLAFSSNYRYLVTTAPDMQVRIFLWPDLTSLLEIGYYEPVKAVAWHPQETGLLCIGGGLGDGSLSLWNVNRLDSLGFRRIPVYGGVEDLAWNKVSGELVVQWSYWESATRYTIMPVFASLDRIVDVMPVAKETRVNYMLWNPDHSQLATHSGESIAVWNFFGNEYQNKKNSVKSARDTHRRKKVAPVNYQDFRHFNIR